MSDRALSVAARPRRETQTSSGFAERVAPGISKMLFVITAVVFTFIAAAREIPSTSDDIFYLWAFSGFRDFGQGLIDVVIDEPGFKLITNFISSFDTPITAVRLLIIATIVPHLLVALRWESKRAWIYLFGWFGIVELAGQLSYVQLRQGFAVGLFLLLMTWVGERRSFVAAVFTGLFHTVMMLLAPAFALQWLKNRKLAYGIIFGVAGLLVLSPAVLSELIPFFGRRQSVYLWKDAFYSPIYIGYSFVLIAYVTYFTWSEENKDRLLAYHGMAALVLPIFVLPTFGAFAERLYFVVRWYELYIVVKNRRRNSTWVGVGYLGMNFSYTTYHSFRYLGVGGWFDRVQSILVTVAQGGA